MKDHRVVHEAIWAPLIVGAFLVGRFFPFERVSFLTCPFRSITSIPCLTCGGTRAVMAFTRFDLARAFEMNPLVTLAAAAGVLYVLHALRVLVSRRPWRPSLSRGTSTALRLAAIAAIVSNWSYLIAVGR